MDAQLKPLRRSHNWLLESLPEDEREQLSPYLRPAYFSIGRVVFEADEPIEEVYFPESGVVSVVTTSAEGESVEISMIGFEGVAGVPVFLGDGVARNRRAVAQV